MTVRLRLIAALRETNKLNDLVIMDKGFGGLADIISRVGSEIILIISSLLVVRFCTGFFYMPVARLI